MAVTRLVIFTDEPGWHGRRLRRWFAGRGLGADFVSLKACRFELGEHGHGVVIPGYEAGLPAAVFVRGVPGGSLEEITLRLDFLHVLEALGCAVFNPASAIERTVDKARTSALLRAHEIPTPATFVSADPAAAREYVIRALAGGRTLVKKPLFGSQGKGLRQIREPADLGHLMPGEVAYLQDFVAPRDGLYRDCRVMVIDGVARAAMERVSEHWVTNRAQGASCHPLVLDATVGGLAEAACAAVGADYAGVDLLRRPDGGWLVTEVNGIPAWQGLQRAARIDITAALGEALLARIEGRLARLA